MAVGGSMIVPEAVDTDFLKKFKKLVLKYVEKGYKFAIVTGGGKPARDYQAAGSKVSDLNDVDRDWLGIYATQFNAQLVRVIFGKLAHPKIITNPTLDIDFKEKILVASGWEPGCSTDYDTVLLAKNLGATTLVNLSNIDYVYDSDPKKNKNAKPLREISWDDLIEMLPSEWTPGLNTPFDPKAAQIAREEGMEVVTMNGANLANLENYLDGKDFKGTSIRP